jgi:hypothetical protein
MFQTSINVNPAYAVAGDFATLNPRNSAIPAPGGVTGAGFIAGTGGLTVGLFAWADTSTNTILLNAGSGIPATWCPPGWALAICSRRVTFGSSTWVAAPSPSA